MLIAPSTTHVPILAAFARCPFPGSSVPLSSSLLRLCHCCLPPLLPLTVTPSDRPLHPPLHVRWWSTVVPPVSRLSHCGRVICSTPLTAPQSEVLPSICVEVVGPWFLRNIPSGFPGTWTCLRNFMPHAGPGRLCGGPLPSWL